MRASRLKSQLQLSTRVERNVRSRSMTFQNDSTSVPDAMNTQLTKKMFRFSRNSDFSDVCLKAGLPDRGLSLSHSLTS